MTTSQDISYKKWREEQSAILLTLAEMHSRGWLARIYCKLHFYYLRWSNRPLSFIWVGSDEGIPIGKPIEVLHLTLHDMMHHQADGVMTGMLLLEGLRANAVQRVSFKRLDTMHAITTIQPRLV